MCVFVLVCVFCVCVSSLCVVQPVLVLCGYISGPKAHRGKRKNPEAPHCPPPPKTPHLNVGVYSFKSTECLLLSLTRRGRNAAMSMEDEEEEEDDDSPMREVFSSKVEPRAAPLRGACAGRVLATRRASAGDLLSGSCLDLPSRGSTSVGMGPRRRPQSFSLDAAAEVAAPTPSEAPGQWRSQRVLFRSEENLLSASRSSRFARLSEGTDTPDLLRFDHKVSASMASLSCRSRSPAITVTDTDPELPGYYSTRSTSISRCSSVSDHHSVTAAPPLRPYRPRSVGNLIDIGEHTEMSASCFSINAPVAEITMRPDFTSTVDLRGPSARMGLGGSSVDLRPGYCLNRRCQSSVDLFRPGAAAGGAAGAVRAAPAGAAVSAAPAPAAASSVSAHARRLNPDQSKTLSLCLCQWS